MSGADSKIVTGPQKLQVVLALLVASLVMLFAGWDGWSFWGLFPLQYLSVIPLIVIVRGLSGADIWTPYLGPDPAPRDAAGGRIIAFRGGLLLAWLSLLPLVFVGGSVASYVRLAVRGERVVARITAKVDAADPSQRKLAYAFSTPRGEQRAEASVSKHVWDAAQSGGAVQVAFNPAKPAENGPVFDAQAVLGFVGLLLGIFVTGVLLMGGSLRAR